MALAATRQYSSTAVTTKHFPSEIKKAPHLAMRGFASFGLATGYPVAVWLT
jgi:hypothetical protein